MSLVTWTNVYAFPVPDRKALELDVLNISWEEHMAVHAENGSLSIWDDNNSRLARDTQVNLSTNILPPPCTIGDNIKAARL